MNCVRAVGTIFRPPQVYKQKLKHVLLEQQSATTGLQTDAATARSLVQNQNANTELRLQNDGHNLQADFREKKLHNENLLKELKLVSLDLWCSAHWWLFPSSSSSSYSFTSSSTSPSSPTSFFHFSPSSSSSSSFYSSSCVPLQKHQVELMDMANDYDKKIRGN